MNYLESVFYKIKNWCSNWIYPAYYLRNLLWYRNDRVKLTDIKPWEYAEPAYRMERAVFTLIDEFLDDKDIESIVWYADGKGNEGPKYGDNRTDVMFPELKGKWVLDLVKEIHKFNAIDKVLMEADYSYLTDVWATYICELNIENGMLQKVKKDYTFDSPEIQALDWTRICMYIKKEDFFNDNVLNDKITELEKEIEDKTQYYLHLAIELRNYLWI